MFEALMQMVSNVPHEISLGRMIESVVLLSIIWSKLKPHLKKIEDRLEGLETAVKTGFDNGETRFKLIEWRISALEQTKGPANGTSSNDQSLRFESAPQAT